MISNLEKGFLTTFPPLKFRFQRDTPENDFSLYLRRDYLKTSIQIIQL